MFSLGLLDSAGHCQVYVPRTRRCTTVPGVVCKAHHDRRAPDYRPRCFDPPAADHGYCPRHYLETFTERKARNRRRGLCRCGAERIRGRTARGLPYRTCYGCWGHDRARRRQRKARYDALPWDLRRYAMPWWTGPHLAHAERLWRCEIVRDQPPASALSLLTIKQQAFVRYYVEQGQRNASQAARLAGYGEQSTVNGSSAARVAGCLLLKRDDVQAAIREVADELVSERAEQRRRDQEMLAALQAELDRRAMLRALDRLADQMEAAAHRHGPQSTAARTARRFRRQAVLRLPGHCRCGARADSPKGASCAKCRRERRHYRRRYRANRGPLRAAC